MTTISLQELKPADERLTKRRQIYESLQQQIRARKTPAGSPLPTTQQLARHFGVTYATVQAAMTDLVHDGWLVRHQGKGTFVAETAQQKKRPLTSDLVAVLPVQEDIAAAGTATELLQILNGCTTGAAACGGRVGMVSLPSVLTPEDIPAALEQILPHDGAIFYGEQYALLIEELARRRFPVVGAAYCSAVVPWVFYDREAATRLGVAHLLEHGHRRLGFFGKLTGEKYRYFCQALEQRGVPVEPARSEDCRQWRDAYGAALRFVASPARPEAVLVENPHSAQTLVQVAQSRGVMVPEDLAVVTYGVDEVAADLSLSCVAVPYREIGQEAATVLDQLIQGRLAPPVERILQAKLVTRRSCGCTPALGSPP